jgi:hypothetical protein
MGLSKYYGNAAANGSGLLSHTISNPDNASFNWLNNSHVELRLSSAGQSLVAFQAAVKAGQDKLSLFNDYSITGKLLEVPSLTNGATYQFEIRRITPKSTHYVNFQAGSPITETDLDNSNNYALYRTQELEDTVANFSEYELTLAKMKTAAGTSGDFVDTDSAQTVLNKTFPSTGSGSNFDAGQANWSGN